MWAVGMSPASSQAAVAGCQRLLPRSPALPAAPGLLWASLEAVLGRRCAPAAAWSPVGVYKGPGGPHHAAGSAPCGHAALLVPSSHGSANCQPPLKVTVDRLSAQQNSPKSQETQASVCPTRHRFNRAKTRRWHGVMLIHLWDGAIDQRGGTLVVVYVLVCGVPSESRPGTWNIKKIS